MLSDTMPDFLYNLRQEMMAGTSESNDKIQTRLQEYVLAHEQSAGPMPPLSSQERAKLVHLFQDDPPRQVWQERVTAFVEKHALITDEK